MLPEPEDIEDPHGKEYAKFRTAAEQTNKALRTILTSMRSTTALRKLRCALKSRGSMLTRSDIKLT